MPFGQVPVFEVDGVKICQSLAIARFIGEEYGLWKGFRHIALEIVANLYFIDMPF